MDKYQYIRDHVTAQAAAERYGVEIRRGRARCIWHEDRNPSLSFKGSFCKCFACDAGGSCIDVTMQLFGLDVKDAAVKLNTDFGLGLDVDRSVPAAAVRRAQEDKQLVKALDIWISRAHTTLAAYWRELTGWQEKYRPTNRDGPFNPKWVRAFADYDYTGYMLDEFEAARTPAEKVKLYKSFRQEVARIERELHADGGHASAVAERGRIA